MKLHFRQQNTIKLISVDWNPLTYDDGVNAPEEAVAYRASKVSAARAAWEFLKLRQPAFDLVSLYPGIVFRAFLLTGRPRSITDLNTSNKIVWNTISAGESNPVPPTRAPVWVDVRDVADALVKALATREAGGGRMMVAAGVYCN